MRIPRNLSLTLCASLALASLAVAHPGDKKSLVVRGRTVDAEGFPIPKTHVWAEGARKASVISDADGRFTLEIPIGSPDEIRATGIHLAVHAERKGWRFAIPGGDATMALDLTIEPGAGGTAQSVAHSNVDRFASAAAEIVALDGEGAGLTEINFLGAHGEVAGAAPRPTLSQTAHASLAFALNAPAPTSGSAAPSPQAGAAEAPRAGASAEGAAGPSSSLEKSPEKSKATAPSTKSSGTASHRGASAAKGGGAAIGAQKATKTKGKSSASADTETLSRVRASAARESVKATKQAAARSHDPMAVVQGRARKALERAAVNASDPRDTALAGAFRSHAADSGPSAGDTVALRVVPAPTAGGSRSRAAPLVIRAARRLTASGSDSCRCRIIGTVEVDSNEPLKRPERVELSLMLYPQVRDTVELFMGSPRPFRLGPARCGRQRLHLAVLTSGRFTVRSTEAFDEFQCDGGRVVEQRVVLVPH